MKSKISVITAAKNAEATIGATIESLKAQTYKRVEHIIIDGLSEDNTAKLAGTSLGEGDIFVSEKDSGIYDALNRGIGLATGDIIGILHADDVYFDMTVLEQVARDFDESPNTDIVYGNVVYVKPHDAEKVARIYRSIHFKPWMLYFGFMPAHTAMFVRRRVFDVAGKYNADFASAGDFEFLVRINRDHQFSVRFIDKYLVKMMLGGASTSGLSSFWRTTVEIRKALQMHSLPAVTTLIIFRLPIKYLAMKFHQVMFGRNIMRGEKG